MSDNKSRTAGEQGEEGNKAKEWLTIISAFSAIAAALLSGFVSLRVTKIQSDTQQLVVHRQDSVERAKLFRQLIGDLNDPEKSGYALLTLWKIYEHDKDRQVVVLAALESPNEDTIQTLVRLGFEKELEKYSETLSRVAKSGTGKAAEAANKIILKALSPVNTAKYLIDVIENLPILEPHDPNAERLIELCKNNKDARILIAEQEKKTTPAQSLFAYILYRAEFRESFRNYLKAIKGDLAKYELFVELVSKLTPSDIRTEDWPLLIDASIDFLTNNEAGSRIYSEPVAFGLLNQNDLGDTKITTEQKEDIIRLASKYILNSNVDDSTRSKALDSLLSWSPDDTLMTIAKYLSCNKGEEQLLTSVSISDALTNQQIKIKSPPDADADSVEWRKWLKNRGLDSNFKCRG